MEGDWTVLRNCLQDGIPNNLPPHPEFDNSVDHAPARRKVLNNTEKILALKNALRYFDAQYHEILAAEFLNELEHLAESLCKDSGQLSMK